MAVGAWNVAVSVAVLLLCAHQCVAADCRDSSDCSTGQKCIEGNCCKSSVPDTCDYCSSYTGACTSCLPGYRITSGNCPIGKGYRSYCRYDSECRSGDCYSRRCTAGRAAGLPCSDNLSPNDQCISGNCIDGRCCLSGSGCLDCDITGRCTQCKDGYIVYEAASDKRCIYWPATTMVLVGSLGVGIPLTMMAWKFRADEVKRVKEQLGHGPTMGTRLRQFIPVAISTMLLTTDVVTDLLALSEFHINKQLGYFWADAVLLFVSTAAFYLYTKAMWGKVWEATAKLIWKLPPLINCIVFLAFFFAALGLSPLILMLSPAVSMVNPKLAGIVAEERRLRKLAEEKAREAAALEREQKARQQRFEEMRLKAEAEGLPPPTEEDMLALEDVQIGLSAAPQPGGSGRSGMPAAATVLASPVHSPTSAGGSPSKSSNSRSARASILNGSNKRKKPRKKGAWRSAIPMNAENKVMVLEALFEALPQSALQITALTTTAASASDSLLLISISITILSLASKFRSLVFVPRALTLYAGFALLTFADGFSFFFWVSTLMPVIARSDVPAPNTLGNGSDRWWVEYMMWHVLGAWGFSFLVFAFRFIYDAVKNTDGYVAKFCVAIFTSITAAMVSSLYTVLVSPWVFIMGCMSWSIIVIPLSARYAFGEGSMESQEVHSSALLGRFFIRLQSDNCLFAGLVLLFLVQIVSAGAVPVAMWWTSTRKFGSDATVVPGAVSPGNTFAADFTLFAYMGMSVMGVVLTIAGMIVTRVKRKRRAAAKAAEDAEVELQATSSRRDRVRRLSKAAASSSSTSASPSPRSTPRSSRSSKTRSTRNPIADLEVMRA